jgi:hypothetical protein
MYSDRSNNESSDTSVGDESSPRVCPGTTVDSGFHTVVRSSDETSDDHCRPGLDPVEVSFTWSRSTSHAPGVDVHGMHRTLG